MPKNTVVLDKVITWENWKQWWVTFFLTLYVSYGKWVTHKVKLTKYFRRHSVTILSNLICNSKSHHLCHCVWNDIIIDAHTMTEEILVPNTRLGTQSRSGLAVLHAEYGTMYCMLNPCLTVLSILNKVNNEFDKI